MRPCSCSLSLPPLSLSLSLSLPPSLPLTTKISLDPAHTICAPRSQGAGATQLNNTREERHSEVSIPRQPRQLAISRALNRRREQAFSETARSLDIEESAGWCLGGGGVGEGGQGVARVTEAITRPTQQGSKNGHTHTLSLSLSQCSRNGHIQPPLRAPTTRALAPSPSNVTSIFYTFYVYNHLESAHPQNALPRPAHLM